MIHLSKSLSVGEELSTYIIDVFDELMYQNKKIVVVKNDSKSPKKWENLRKENLEQLFHLEVSEENLIGIAAGLNLVEYTPFVHISHPIDIRKMFDQLFISDWYVEKTLNILGLHSRSIAKQDEKNYTAEEDIALMAMIPHSIVCEAADHIQMAWIMKEFSQYPGVHYVRGNNKRGANVYAKGSIFQLGKGNILCNGTDILMIVAGQFVFEALSVANHLKAYKISCEVIDMFTIKPIDHQLILDESSGKKQVITMENYVVIGGLSSAVECVLAEYQISVSLKKIAVVKLLEQMSPSQQEAGLAIQSIAQIILESYRK
ncbi:transketolase C-terminal domain-containing protein [Enterococcus villorum]|uniref:Transketolase n=2 Tax=Enterococcus villorum TaxID=112904 RepID=A0A511J4N4_9ENTE|nr:transketolase C-terminal domain-containing protein [Enterococcus villorum]EOH86392.1 hypothetical protein UAO_02505 [Enterococcus villorum ATCC 700913]EOW78804.1 hypothetical protein I591_00347 [Enterococcus villorum ATCC 700913]GEL92944.1 transketolase [Enterococcus villorum]